MVDARPKHAFVEACGHRLGVIDALLLRLGDQGLCACVDLGRHRRRTLGLLAFLARLLLGRRLLGWRRCEVGRSGSVHPVRRPVFEVRLAVLQGGLRPSAAAPRAGRRFDLPLKDGAVRQGFAEFQPRACNALRISMPLRQCSVGGGEPPPPPPE